MFFDYLLFGLSVILLVTMSIVSGFITIHGRPLVRKSQVAQPEALRSENPPTVSSLERKESLSPIPSPLVELPTGDRPSERIRNALQTIVNARKAGSVVEHWGDPEGVADRVQLPWEHRVDWDAVQASLDAVDTDPLNPELEDFTDG